jgi:hypothetical protein
MSDVESVFGSLRPERMDSRALTPFYVFFGMEVSLLVRARGPMCLAALVVGAGVWGLSSSSGPAHSRGEATATSPKMTSDAVLPSVELVS